MPTRVLIVDDSKFMQVSIRSLLERGDDISVVGFAKDGREAIEKTRELKPDVITMDVNMPVMNGVEAVRHIMKECPTPIVMVSSVTVEGAQETIFALEAGAVDYVQKPGGTVTTELFKVEQALREKILGAARANPRALGHILGAGTQPRRVAAPAVRGSTAASEEVPLLCIGSSTGGPATLQALLSQLPQGLPCHTVIVQHMPANYTGALAARLAEQTSHAIREALDGETLSAGTVLVAPGGVDTVLSSGRMVHLQAGAGDVVFTPSIDVFLLSAAAVGGKRTIAVILTGIGSDGTKGCRAVNAAGGHVVAQDEASCVVYGMPRAAKESGCVDKVLPLDQIGPYLVSRLSG